jgi:hypothetical protein
MHSELYSYRWMSLLIRIGLKSLEGTRNVIAIPSFYFDDMRCYACASIGSREPWYFDKLGSIVVGTTEDTRNQGNTVGEELPLDDPPIFG